MTPSSSRLAARLARAEKKLTSSPTEDPAVARAAEWFLDNYYLVRRAARQVARELPSGFARRLPRIDAGPEKGLPRIDVFSRAVVGGARLELDANELLRFVREHQERTPFTIAELWALPTVLRTAVLCALVHFLTDLNIVDGEPEDEERSEASIPLEPALGVERSIRALRVLADIDWKDFFQRTNRADAVLGEDPAYVYEHMDFATRDAYRKAVEELAWSARASEEDVARRAVALARAGTPDARRGHVGYYLVDEGRRALEREIGYRARGIARVRAVLTWWPALTLLLSLALFTAVPLVLAGMYAARAGGRAPVVAASVVAGLLPASMLGMAAVQWALAKLLAPKALPKLDLSKGIPPGWRTLVVVPTLLARREDVESLVRQLELHYLANPDPQLRFALLTDDADTETWPPSPTLLEIAARRITELNEKHGRGGPGPFHLLHREARWNPAEERFMGWERKRGKLEELNRLLRGSTDTSYMRHVGDPEGLQEIRFVITLDSDTQLPMGAAQRMIGLLAHPLNRAVYDPAAERVVAGYAIVQPRVETSPSSARPTPFSRIFAGDIGFDIYTHAVSDMYQDLFGAGIYVGKGIYDVDAFMKSLDGRVPENALASHDLFEGVHARTALATDIVLFEEYPAHYIAFARRMHRWVRGDWQLLPWLFPKVPSAGRGRIRNPLALGDLWKIVDNLRRSLTVPALFVFLVSGWTWLPGRAWVWTLAGLGALLVPVLPALRGRSRRVESLARAAFALGFLAHEAAVIVDAVARVLVRMTITRKRLLEWTCAAHVTRKLQGEATRALFWREMLASLMLSGACAALVAYLRPSSLAIAAPFFATWLLAPEIARAVSRSPSRRDRALPDSDVRELRKLARRTWLFFESHVGPNDQWLPVDNYQEEPREQTAHRTSPTNIGMMLLSTLSAYDLGYIGVSELSLRLRSAMESIGRLAHYQGHLLNWYETKNLEPLLPRYVSTVDSGNFAGCLLALAHGCRGVARAPVRRISSWAGLSDSLALLREAVDDATHGATGPLRSVIARLDQALQRGREEPHAAYAVLLAMSEELIVELDNELLALLEAGVYRHDPEILRRLRTWVDRLHHQVQGMQREIDLLLPWLAMRDEPVCQALSLPGALRLDEIAGASRALLDAVANWERGLREENELSPDLEASAVRFREALEASASHAAALDAELSEVASRAEAEVRGMDFRLLFDCERKLFRIGYNVTLDQVDPHHYDLLASEARLASYLAIVMGQVPESHWYALGRPMTRAGGGLALLSWGGTMFEYLMPTLLMRSHDGSLLARSCELAVKAQIAYGAKKGVPWGISESAYARLDAHQTYQYRSFGAPGLGFKRGLEDDLVIAPYASMLAVTMAPHEVVANLAAFDAMGMLGTYGLFEALDLEPDHAVDGGRFTIVRSYMAHHQGMTLVALDNALNDRIMVERFHAEPLIEAGEMLLNERMPAAPPVEGLGEEGHVREAPAVHQTHAATSPAWLPFPSERSQAFPLSNGRLSSVLTGGGGGGLQWKGIALTSYRPDPSCDEEGMWIYLRDEESRHVMLATSEQGRTTYTVHKAEFHRRDQGISIRVDVAVAPADDVEVRQITVHNETDRPRRFTLTTAAEPVLLAADQAFRHPAFARLFVESELLADLEGLLFARRPRTTKEEGAVFVQRLVREGAAVTFSGYETDRTALFGRCQERRNAIAAHTARHGRTGTVVDPVASLTASIELKPKATATLAVVTTVGRSRSVAIELARRYGSMHAVRWVFRDAEQESVRRLQRDGLDPALLPFAQRLFSALLFSDPALRAPPEVLAAAKPCKSRLWGRGISGDDPILLVRVHDGGAPLLREIIGVQRFLRSSGTFIDVVLLDEQASSYATEGSGTLRSALASYEVEEWLNRRGGIFVLAADQISDGERRRLEATARVVLDTRDQSIASRLSKTIEPRPNLPRFTPSLASEVPARPMPRPTLLFDNGIGGFTEDGREYVLSVGPDRLPPAPWCNVLANPRFGCLASESALGASWSLNSGENRLTPWRNDPIFDTPSEALYLRDEETAAVWSPTPLPAGMDAETLVRHGAGYTIYARESHGLQQELTIFVPPDTPLKVVRLRVTNTLPRHRRLTATYYAEWVLGGQREEQQAYIVSEFHEEHACLLATCGWNDEFADRAAFLASESKAHGFTCDRGEFLGRQGGYARPEGLERWGLGGRAGAGLDPCAALQVHLELEPGAGLETCFVLGEASNAKEALELAARFRDRASSGVAWTELNAFWDELLGGVQVETPDRAMNVMLNRWLLYQSVSSRIFGRTGFYQSSGAFGYRDQLQDVLALVHTAPSLVRAHILEAAAHQFEEGDVLHWWHPPSGRGVRTRCSDDLLWLPFVAAEYVNATGDASILHEAVPFLTGEPLQSHERDRYAHYEASAKTAPLFEHCRRALARGATRGRHGLPLMGDGDWNDGMNRVGAGGTGESVWLGWFLYATMQRFAALCDRTEQDPEGTVWRARAESLRAQIDACAWDGGWYLRAFHDDGSLVGSANERECCIDSIAQSWAVLSGAAPAERARKAIRAAEEQLVREDDRLLLLLWPPFTGTVHDPGYIRAYPPGVRENGGQYTHAAAWLGWAHIGLGDGARAERIFRLLNPVLRTRSGPANDRYRVEPYVLAGDIYSVEPWTGRGGWTWYTGAAAWTWRLGIEGILGLKREDGQLHLDPCIPPEWKRFEAWVCAGKQEIHVVVENPEAVSTGIAVLTVDGTIATSTRIPLDPGASNRREVLVRLGAPPRAALPALVSERRAAGS